MFVIGSEFMLQGWTTNISSELRPTQLFFSVPLEAFSTAPYRPHKVVYQSQGHWALLCPVRCWIFCDRSSDGRCTKQENSDTYKRSIYGQMEVNLHTFYTISLEKVRGQLPASASSLPWELLGGWWIGLRLVWRRRNPAHFGSLTAFIQHFDSLSWDSYV